MVGDYHKAIEKQFDTIDSSNMEKRPSKESDSDLPDPFLERCRTKKRELRDPFFEGQRSKRYAIDPLLSQANFVGSTDRELRDPFEDYVHPILLCQILFTCFSYTYKMIP